MHLRRQIIARLGLTGYFHFFILQVISKMHLTLNNCVTPRSGIHADFMILGCIKSLLKMLTYYTYAGNNDFGAGFCLILERKLLFLR